MWINKNPHLTLVRLTDRHGHISDGAGNYSVGVKCSWLIDARDRRPNHLAGSAGLSSSTALLVPSSGKQPTIRLHLEEFATECGWDHLYVYDGDSVESPLLAVFRWVKKRQMASKEASELSGLSFVDVYICAAVRLSRFYLFSECAKHNGYNSRWFSMGPHE